MALHLHEEILLLALRDEKGTIDSKASMYGYAVAGAILTELFLTHRVRVGEGKKKLVEVVDQETLHDPLLDEAVALIAGAKRARTASYWVGRLARMKRLRHRVAEGLCRRGILRDTEDRILLLFRRKIYPTIDPTPERRLIERLRRAILGEGKTVSPKTSVLIALTHATGMLAAHFPKAELKRRRKRLESIANGDLVGAATREAVQAAQAAAAAALIAASVAATTVSTR